MALNKADFVELSDWIKDTLAMLVNEPELLVVEVSRDEDDGSILVEIEGPRSELAMFIGRGGANIDALVRLSLAAARRAGHKGAVDFLWEPVESEACDDEQLAA